MELLIYIILLAFFVVGCWEASLVSEYEPSLHTSPGEKQGYAFTIICAFVNIVGSAILTYSLVHATTGYIYQACIFIWSCVLFAGIFNHHTQTGPFQDVVIVQFSLVLTSSVIGMIGYCVSKYADSNARVQ